MILRVCTVAVLTGTASSMIAVGLSYKQAIGACVLGNFIMGLVITINGRIGAKVRSCPCHRSEPWLTWDSFTHLSRFLRACRLATTSATSLSCHAASSPLCGSG